MKKNPSFKGKRVTVFGLGLNEGGVGTVKFLAAQDVKEIIVTDVKKREELAPSLEKLASLKNITYVLGAHRPEDFSRVDMVIKNPVIPWTNEYIRLAESMSIPVEMDSSLFFAFCHNPIIGVTGTKGKTSVSSMIAHLLESAGSPVARVGISQMPVLGALGKIRPEDTVVFELSSWRLSALGRKKKSPHIAVVTNLFPDHLNYYKTMAAYARDKRYIFEFQEKDDFVIFNADNEMTRVMAENAPSRVFWYSERGEIPGDGVAIRDGAAVFFRGGREETLFSVDDIHVPGTRTRENMLAATVAAILAGVSPEKIAEGVRSWKGAPHRLEFIAKKRGVEYWNDSAATIPEAAISALRSFEGKKIILIGGGADKNLEFASFAKEIADRTKGVILFQGNATEAIRRELCRIIPENERYCTFDAVASMGKAIELASRVAESGDVVLLSPGAASFGLFKNEFDRGNQFKEMVAALPDA